MTSSKKNKYNGMYIALAGVGTVAAGYYALGWLRDNYFSGFSTSEGNEFDEAGRGDVGGAEEWKEYTDLRIPARMGDLGSDGNVHGIEEDDTGRRLGHSLLGDGGSSGLDDEGSGVFTTSRGSGHVDGVSHTIERDDRDPNEDERSFSRQDMAMAARTSPTHGILDRRDDRESSKFATAHSSSASSRHGMIG
jgi:hypothetical protein